MAHEHESRGIMSSYTLAGILAQPIPDHLILDIALHLQANDNRCANQQSRQLNNFLDRPPHQSGKAFVVISGGSHGDPRWLPPGSKAQDLSERLGTLWTWCRTAATCSREVAASVMTDPFLAGTLNRQPG
jgi:hypothetical protein